MTISEELNKHVGLNQSSGRGAKAESVHEESINQGLNCRTPHRTSCGPCSCLCPLGSLDIRVKPAAPALRRQARSDPPRFPRCSFAGSTVSTCYAGEDQAAATSRSVDRTRPTVRRFSAPTGTGTHSPISFRTRQRLSPPSRRNSTDGGIAHLQTMGRSGGALGSDRYPGDRRSSSHQ